MERGTWDVEWRGGRAGLIGGLVRKTLSNSRRGNELAAVMMMMENRAAMMMISVHPRLRNVVEKIHHGWELAIAASSISCRDLAILPR